MCSRLRLQGGLTKRLFISGKPCSASLMNGVRHFPRYFVCKRLVTGTVSGVCETHEHGKWLRRRRNSVGTAGDMLGPHKPTLASLFPLCPHIERRVKLHQRGVRQDFEPEVCRVKEPPWRAAKTARSSLWPKSKIRGRA
ncbi:unnamed protein product [Ixodes pacificus]